MTRLLQAFGSWPKTTPEHASQLQRQGASLPDVRDAVNMAGGMRAGVRAGCPAAASGRHPGQVA
jgi:hypothetical protein